MNRKLYPLKFKPLLQERIWGSDRLVKSFGKQIPIDEDGNPSIADTSHIGESWEISAMGEDRNSEIAEGYLAENTLDDILETYMGDLVGDNIFDYYNMTFPLLVKILDIQERLSVQVHPDDETAGLRFDSYGKTECWYVMEASDTAKVYMGFKREVSAGEFYEKCKDGTVEELLNVYHPQAGDAFFIPAGTVHSCGGGLVIAEVQEPSDITFRLYDWGRENDPKTARQMFLEEAIDCIDYMPYDDKAFHTHRSDRSITVADCPQFTASVVKLRERCTLNTEDFNSCVAFICTEGEVSVRADKGEDVPLRRGESMLIPASVDGFSLTPVGGAATLFEAHIRKIEDEPDDYINEGVSAIPAEEGEDGHYKN